MIGYLITGIVSTAVSITLAAVGHVPAAALCGVIACWCTHRVYKALQRSRTNIITILKAIENNDNTYSLYTPKGGSSTESELNQTLNRIKDILQSTREEIRQNEEFLSHVISEVPTGIIITTPEGTIKIINPSALRLLSLPIVTHLHRIGQIYPEISLTLSQMNENDSKTVTIFTEKESRSLHLGKKCLSSASSPLHIYTIQDIGDELDQRETDSWIALIRVMTHEIMNSIAPIRSISEVLLSTVPQGLISERQVLDAVTSIHGTSDTLIKFVSDYRKFSSVPTPQPQILSVQELVQRTRTLLAQEIKGKNIHFGTHLDPALPTITADPELTTQVLLNLFKNAIEATPYGGSLTVTSKVKGNLRPTIEVYNSGEPIPDEIKSQIFIPFFTTKEGGSGIGLSLSRYIMRLHGGNLRYRPLPDGVIFVMEF